MANITIPKEYSARKKLVAIPEKEYRAFLAYIRSDAESDEVREVRQSEEDVKAGRVIEASSAEEALKKAGELGWLD